MYNKVMSDKLNVRSNDELGYSLPIKMISKVYSIYNKVFVFGYSVLKPYEYLLFNYLFSFCFLLATFGLSSLGILFLLISYLVFNNYGIQKELFDVQIIITFKDYGIVLVALCFLVIGFILIYLALKKMSIFLMEIGYLDIKEDLIKNFLIYKIFVHFVIISIICIIFFIYQCWIQAIIDGSNIIYDCRVLKIERIYNYDYIIDYVFNIVNKEEGIHITKEDLKRVIVHTDSLSEALKKGENAWYDANKPLSVRVWKTAEYLMRMQPVIINLFISLGVLLLVISLRREARFGTN